MKNNILLMCLIVFIVGCGSNGSEAKFKGVKDKRDYMAQGMKYLSLGDVQRAIQSFDEAIKRDPQNSEKYITLGQVYLRLKNFDRATDSFSAATRVSPDNGEAYYLLAYSKGLAGNRQDAIEAAQKSVEIFMQSKDEERFKRSLVLLRGLMEADGIPGGMGMDTQGMSVKMMDEIEIPKINE